MADITHHDLHQPTTTLPRIAFPLAQWMHNYRTRKALGHLNDDTLRDIGISRLAAMEEANKPFWR